MLSIADALAKTKDRVVLAGVTAFEGLFPMEESRLSTAMRDYLDDVCQAVDILLAREILPRPFFISAGGSAAFDIIVDSFQGRWKAAKVILRSGCYITHDHGMYAKTSPLREDLVGSRGLRAAFELWSYAQSCPEPQVVFLTFGRRDAPYDYGLPRPLFVYCPTTGQHRDLDGAVIEHLNDHHARLRIPEGCEVNVGDMVVCGSSHPCAAFDRWRLIPLIDDNTVVVDAILTYF